MILLFISFWSGFAWYPIYGDANVYETVLNSEEGLSIINQYGGEGNLVKSSIPIDADIFRGGEMVLLPKGVRIRQTPINLKFMKRAIEMEKYDRYSAIYKEGAFIREWQELESEIESKLGISSLDEISRERLREIFPERIHPPEEETERMSSGVLGSEEAGLVEEGKEEIDYPTKSYFSFLLTEEDSRQKIRIVVIRLSPIDELIEKFNQDKEQGGER